MITSWIGSNYITLYLQMRLHLAFSIVQSFEDRSKLERYMDRAVIYDHQNIGFVEKKKLVNFFKGRCS